MELPSPCLGSQQESRMVNSIQIGVTGGRDMGRGELVYTSRLRLTIILKVPWSKQRRQWVSVASIPQHLIAKQIITPYRPVSRKMQIWFVNILAASKAFSKEQATQQQTQKTKKTVLHTFSVLSLATAAAATFCYAHASQSALP